MGKGYRSSHPSKRLPTARLMPRVGQLLSLSSDATIAHHNTSSHGHSNKRHDARCKEIVQSLSREQQEYVVYENVSFQDYIYIADQLESVGYAKAWKRLTFLPGSQILMVVSPSAAHESVLSILMEDLCAVLVNLPVPRKILACRTLANNYLNGDSIYAIPDLCIQMESSTSVWPRPLWIMESAFAQPDADVMRKLHAYVSDEPNLLVVGKITLNQATPYRSPGSKGSIAKELRSSELLTKEEWGDRLGDLDAISQVVVDGHTWFSLSSVEIHLWVRQPGDTRIVLDRQEGDGYALGTLYPTFHLDGINKAFRHGLGLVKETIIRELEKISDVEQATIRSMEDWSPPSQLLDPTWLSRALKNAAQITAYNRYYDWRSKLKKKPYSRAKRHTRASQTASRDAPRDD
ncbi:hypothetical protein EDD17DRAFT_981447 [Pisolithus thermaeus]|nr:hypothetical protein EV401DRAFT_214032 [Pisolithus croceorrhizus]KAI6158788.1 hypothetical protein EDD17DRAFT_981447 [Pisolithus thermaeus]